MFLLCVTGMVTSCVFLLYDDVLCVSLVRYWYDDVLCVSLVCYWYGDVLCVSLMCYSRPSIIRTSLIRTLDYPNYQINDIHSICGVHQIELTSPIEIILLHLSEYSVIQLA